MKVIVYPQRPRYAHMNSLNFFKEWYFTSSKYVMGKLKMFLQHVLLVWAMNSIPDAT